MKRVIIIFIIACLFFNFSNLNPVEQLPTKETREVNLSEYGYPVMLRCILPVDAEIKKEYDNYSIELGKDLSIESISWYKKNDYNWDTEERSIRTISKLLEAMKKEGRYTVIEEYENGIYAERKDGTRKASQILVYYFESDEHIYEVRCDPYRSFREGEMDLLMEVISSIEPIQYCYEEVTKINSNDFIYDFLEIGFALKIVLPKQSKIEAYRSNLKDYKIVFGEDKFINASQYHLDNKIDESLPKMKVDIRNESEFIRMVFDDPKGFLAEMYSPHNDKYRYVFFYYFETPCYYYNFDSRWWSLSNGEDSIENAEVDWLKDAYLRVKGLKKGAICKK